MWGDNTFGQLGTHLPGSRNRPVMVMRTVREVSLGYSHTGVIDQKDQIWMCGFNGKYGALGNTEYRNCRRLRKMKQGGFSVENLKLQADRAVLVSDGGDVFVWG